MDNKELLLEYLKDHCTTESEAVKARDLSVMFNTDPRGVRAIVTVLRQDRYPVCSSNKGYWYSTDNADIRKTLNRLQAQADNLLRVIEGLKYRRTE